MMKKILLANIGSRNLQVINDKGHLVTIEDYIRDNRIEKYIGVHEKTFREKYLFRKFTNDIWEEMQIGVFLLSFQLEILTEKIVSGYDKLVLFYSDQIDENYNHQDTLYAAEIIAKKLSYQVPDLVIELRLISGNPTDENNLFYNYALHARSLINENKTDYLYAYLDSGGTTQMKNAAKIVFEYYLKQKGRSLNIQYISYLKDYAEDVERQFSQRYYMLDLASQFVKSFNFHAAESLFIDFLPYNVPKLKSLYEHLMLASHRFSFNGPSNAILPKEHLQDWAINYKDGKIEGNFLPYNELRPSKIDIFEIASLCEHYFCQENFTLATATYYRLCEEICQTYIKSRLNNNLGSQHLREKFKQLVTPEVKTLLSGTIQYGLPLLLSWCVIDSQKRNLQVNKLFTAFLPTISYANGFKARGLNELRNRCWLAHDNKTITKQNIESEVPDFFLKNWPEIVKYLFLPKRNIYEQMQESLLIFFQEI